MIADVGVVPLAFLRYAIGAACLLPFAMMLRARIRRTDLAPIAVIGIAHFAVVILLLNYALELIPAARAALLFATTPLLAIVIEAALRQRGLGLLRLTAVLISFAGVAIALSESPLGASGDAGSLSGDAAVLGSALCAAACSVLYRPYLERYPAVAVGALAMLASVLTLFVATLAVDRPIHAVSIGAEGWLVVIGIGVSSGVGYYLWLWALARERATEVTMFLALSPLTAAALGAVLLGEDPSARLMIGVVLVVTGLWLAQQAPGSRALRSALRLGD